MKKILENKQYQFVALVIIAVLAMILLSFKPNVVTTKVHVYVSNDLRNIQRHIEDWTSYGYEVQEIISQDVAVSVTSRGAYTDTQEREAKGEILLVMIKK